MSCEKIPASILKKVSMLCDFSHLLLVYIFVSIFQTMLAEQSFRETRVTGNVNLTWFRHSEELWENAISYQACQTTVRDSQLSVRPSHLWKNLIQCAPVSFLTQVTLINHKYSWHQIFRFVSYSNSYSNQTYYSKACFSG